MAMKRIGLFFLHSIVSGFVSAQQPVVPTDSTAASEIRRQVLLDEVVVEARSRNIDSRGLGNMRINTNLLKVAPLFLGERDVIKTLQFLPGVSAGMEGSSQLNIRGGTNDQTLYLTDDVPIYNQNHTFGLFSIFNADAIRTAEIYKGGIPAHYGDKLSGGGFGRCERRRLREVPAFGIVGASCRYGSLRRSDRQRPVELSDCGPTFFSRFVA